MWKRLKRALRSVVGWFVSSVEDPELVLEQNIRDLNDQVPKMNESISMVRAHMTLLEKENAKLSVGISDLTAKIKAAIRAGRDDLAAQFAIQLQTDRTALVQNEGQLTSGRVAYEKALHLKKIFLHEKERKTQEAMQAIRDAQRARWQSKVADALESFEVAGIDSTHGEMVRKIEERTAIHEARMHMALESVDHQRYAIEEDAEKIRAQELVKQLKLEMGLAEKAPESSSPPISESLLSETPKTIGKRIETKE